MKKNRAEWEAEIERQHLSGLSQTAYAKREGLNLATFQYWRQKLRKESSVGGAFVEVLSPPSSTSVVSEIELELPHGIVLRMRG